MKIFLSPHNDDETLFGAYTLQREKPLVVVVTDSWVQQNRGDGVTADQRWKETCRAMRLLGCAVVRLGLRDDTLTLDELIVALASFYNVSGVFSPALQHGHKHHDLVCAATREVFREEQIQEYSTYSSVQRSFHSSGQLTLRPTPQELQNKISALGCYTSQLPRSKHHFDAVLRDKREFLSDVGYHH